MCDEGRPGEGDKHTRTHTHTGTHTESKGVLQHTNDKHAQGDEIKILGGPVGGWDVAIGGLRLVIVRRDSGLRGRLGRHSWLAGGRVLLRHATRLGLGLGAWRGDVCACACTMQCTAGWRRW